MITMWLLCTTDFPKQKEYASKFMDFWLSEGHGKIGKQSDGRRHLPVPRLLFSIVLLLFFYCYSVAV